MKMECGKEGRRGVRVFLENDSRIILVNSN